MVVILLLNMDKDSCHSIIFEGENHSSVHLVKEWGVKSLYKCLNSTY